MKGCSLFKSQYASLLTNLLINKAAHASRSTLNISAPNYLHNLQKRSYSTQEIFDYNAGHNCMTSEAPREAWIDSLNPTKDGDEPVGMVILHPDIFGTLPRLDIIKENVKWQQKYRRIEYRHAPTTNECPGGGRKPWPQKGSGRARHGSIRAPQWKNGGTVHGPRKYTTRFYMLPHSLRLQGLISTLCCKFAQDDLKIVNSLDIPSNKPEYIEEVVSDKYWGNSVLFVDKEDIMPENITLATSSIPHFNLLPAYGLNVLCMLKHDTLVLTVEAVKQIQNRLLHQLNKMDQMTHLHDYNHDNTDHRRPINFFNEWK